MDRIRAAVKELGVYVVLGFSERDGGSLYIVRPRLLCFVVS